MEFDDGTESEWLNLIQTYVTQTNVNAPLQNTVHKPTLLHVAAKKGFTSAVSWLVEECQANLDSLNDYKETPLCEALRAMTVSTVRQLLNYGARIDINLGKKNWGPMECVLFQTRLLHKSERQKIFELQEMFELLLDHGGKLDWVVEEFRDQWTRNIVRKWSCKKVCVVLLGIRCRRCSVLDVNVKDITKMIAKTVWESRQAEIWQ